LALPDLHRSKIIHAEDLLQELADQNFETFQLTETPYKELYLNQINVAANGKHSPEANGSVSSGKNNLRRPQIVNKFSEEWSNDPTRKSIALFVNSSQTSCGCASSSHDAFVPFNIGVCLEELFEASLKS